MLQSWYNSASKNRLLFTFRPAFIIFAESGLSGQEMLTDFASRMLKITYNKNVIQVNTFVIIIDLQRVIYNFTIWILKR